MDITTLPRSGLFVMGVLNFDPWRDKIIEILDLINRRSSNRYSAETLMAALERNFYDDPSSHLVLLVLDMAKAQEIEDISEAVVGFGTVDVFVDHVGTEFATLTYGWASSSYRTKPAELAMPVMEAWARARGLARIVSYSERHTAAYGRWIGRWGYRQRETTYEKELHL
jgi:hypothetical protein